MPLRGGPVYCFLLKRGAPEGETGYLVFVKKRAGKPYYVYMTAGANKFLRIYYGKVKGCLRNLEQAEVTPISISPFKAGSPGG